MENTLADAPFGGFDPNGNDRPEGDLFPDSQTDRIMAFDVVKRKRRWIPDRFDPTAISRYNGNNRPVDRLRKVALFEGMDEFGRLQPILGTAEPATDYRGIPVLHTMGPLAGEQIVGAVGWHEPTTENPALNSTEIWEIYNATGDAHPVHLHLVNFQILDREGFAADVIEQPVVQHDGSEGTGFRLENVVTDGNVETPGGEERAPKDMVTAYPDQVTRIKATFDRPGRYVWHCHILSHEDHEMMRVLHVGPGA
jgi:FtsP/CotA-like multicopper oxidase with cupredoxin domain